MRIIEGRCRRVKRKAGSLLESLHARGVLHNLIRIRACLWELFQRAHLPAPKGQVSSIPAE